MKLILNEPDNDIKGHKRKEEKSLIIDFIIKKGLVKNRKQANILLLAFSLLLFSISFLINFIDKFFDEELFPIDETFNLEEQF